jgi:hypothetical protein
MVFVMLFWIAILGALRSRSPGRSARHLNDIGDNRRSGSQHRGEVSVM